MCDRSIDMSFLSLVKFTFIKKNSNGFRCLKIHSLPFQNAFHFIANVFHKSVILSHFIMKASSPGRQFREVFGSFKLDFSLNRNNSIFIQSTSSNPSLIGRLVPDDCLLLGPPWLNLRFPLALASCES